MRDAGNSFVAEGAIRGRSHRQLIAFGGIIAGGRGMLAGREGRT